MLSGGVIVVQLPVLVLYFSFMPYQTYEPDLSCWFIPPKQYNSPSKAAAQMFPKDGITPIDSDAFVGTEETDAQESQAVKAPLAGLAAINGRFVTVIAKNRIVISATDLFVALSPAYPCVAARNKGFLSTFLD